MKKRNLQIRNLELLSAKSALCRSRRITPEKILSASCCNPEHSLTPIKLRFTIEKHFYSKSQAHPNFTGKSPSDILTFVHLVLGTPYYSQSMLHSFPEPLVMSNQAPVEWSHARGAKAENWKSWTLDVGQEWWQVWLSSACYDICSFK